MRVSHEQEAGPDRDFPEPDMTASSHQNNSMQDSNRAQARDITEETNIRTPTVSVEDVSNSMQDGSRFQARDITGESDIRTPTVSVEDVSDDRSSFRSESQFSLGERLAALAISTPVLPRSPSPLLSPDFPLPSVEGPECPTNRDPVTVRDLPNATPRHSRSPEPYFQPGPRAYDDVPHSRMETVDDEPNDPSTEGEDDLIVYPVLNEPLPPGPFSDRDYQNALKSAKALTEDIFTNLSQCDWSARPGTQLHKIKQRAETLNKVDNPASRTIGIVGDSAAGKSSLINCLLHIPNLAHKGDQGSAVTSFVTEYRKRKANHTDNFTIEVDFATPEEINEQIHELLFSFRELYRGGVEAEGLDDLYRSIEKQSEIALTTLQSIFPNSPETEAEHLKGTRGHTFEQIESGLQRLAEGLSWPEGSVNGKWTSSAINARECHDQVAQFMQNGLWPLTNIVRIYLSAQVLKTGIVLADLPGYRDINLARVKKAEEYLFHCDELFVVANINRVVTNESVKEIIRKKLGPHMTINENVCVICTHADEIDLPEYERSRSWTTTANLPEVKAAKQALQKAKRQRARPGSADIRERLQIKYKYLWISARNADIKAKVRREYQANGSNLMLNVFCVGNKDYDMGSQFWDLEAHNIAIEGSGIPELRKHCHSIVAKAQFRVSNHFLEVKVPDLVQSLEVWLASAENETPTTLPFECVPELQLMLSNKVDIFSDSVNKELKTQILDFWRRQERAFNEQAREASREWEVWHHSSYKAWVSRSGTHETAAQGFRRWNDELLRGMNQATEDRWTELLLKLDEKSDIIQEGVKYELDYCHRQMRGSQTPQALLTLLKLKKREIIYLVQEELSVFRRDCKRIKYDASGDHVTSMIVTTMRNTYRECARESGPGMKARMIGIMATRMAEQNIMRFIYENVNTEMSRAIEERVDNISNHTIEMCAELGRHLETVRGEEAQEALRSHPNDLRRIQTTIATARESVLNVQLQATAARALARNWKWIE